RKLQWSRTLAPVAAIRSVAALALLAWLLRDERARGGIRHQRFEADELVAILLENRRGERFSTYDEDGLAVLLQFVHQRDKVAIAADDGERIHVGVCKRHL